VTKLKVAVGIAKCPSTGKIYGVRVEERGSKWVATWAFPIKPEVAKREGYSTNRFPPDITYDKAYPGCPFCKRFENLSEITKNAVVREFSGDIGIYSKWAGVNRIPIASADKYGNADGNEFDLVADGAFSNKVIYVLNLCHQYCSLSLPNAALIKKGFKVIEDIAVQEKREFLAHLNEASQFWLISDCRGHLTSEYVDLIKEYFDAGHGIYIWGDNAPYYVDANKVTSRLFGSTMSGNSRGEQVVSLREEGKCSGIIPNHLISTGIVNIYEGITIAEVTISNAIKPLIYGSNGKVVAAYYDCNGKRALVDGGFTRLYHKWNSAGTDRYIVNAAAWLVNIERFANLKR
jgi:hypothetical protein